jgi:hypothetical protein
MRGAATCCAVESYFLKRSRGTPCACLKKLGAGLLATALAHLHVCNHARKTANDNIFSEGFSR